jgi:subtilisin family serine protease
VKAVGGFPSYASVVCGVDWVTARADTIEVANASFSLPGTDDGACGLKNDDALHYAICNSVEEGVTYVAAASNNRQDLALDVPAAYDEVLAVTAMADYDGRPGGKGTPPKACEPLPGRPLARDDRAETSISNYATPGSADARRTLAAPGSCYPLIYRPGPGQSVVLASGTSFAAPNAAGAAALYASKHPGAAPARVRAALLREVRGRPASYGYGGDPRSPIGGRHYGYLLYAGGF